MTGRGTGSAPYFASSLDEDPAVLVKAGKISLCGFFQYNPGTAAAYIQFHDAAAIEDVTVGTTTPIFATGAAATSFSQGQFCRPIQFTKGMVIVCTSTPTGSGAPNAANHVSLALGD